MYEDQKQQDQDRTQAEAAFRRGWTQATDEATRIVLELVEQGHQPTEIRRLLAVYDDHFLAPWRQAGDLDKREAAPAFNLDQCKAILAKSSGYNWIQ